MTRIISGLHWVSTANTQYGDYVAQVLVDFSIDPDFKIAVTRRDSSVDRDLQPKWLTVDNISNNNVVTVNFGPFSLNVPRYKRNTFAIPDAVNQIEVLTTGGKTNIIIAETRVAADEVDSYQVQVDAQTLAFPSGGILAFGMVTPPSGWLVCDGSQVSRTAYASLYAAILTTWGAGDGVTTFNLPDLRNSFLRGVDGGRGLDTNTPGRAIGTYEPDALASHSHGGVVTGLSGGATVAAGGGYSLIVSNSAATGASETVPKNYAVQFCIKT